VVGRYLAEVGRHRQVLCVTHLPQVAAHADHHFHVDKSLSKKRARSQLRKLGDKDRVEELARMLGGKRVTKKARENARELITAASNS